jgi:acyl phosphate:glycerol-3-phosphate acyltransferase
MMLYAVVALLLGAAYLLGSFPTGYLTGKILKGIDIREHGSGSTGATNVLRTLGKVPGSLVLLADVGKGWAAVSLVTIVNHFFALPTTWQPLLVIGAATMAILGHSKSVWLGFQGGKSVAASLGVLLAMHWPVALLTLGTFGISIAITRIVSISSILGALAVTLFMFAFHQPLAYGIFTLIGGAYVIWLHRTNVERLLAGTEPQIGQAQTDLPEPEADRPSSPIS